MLLAACCCYSPLEAAKLSNFQQNSPVWVPVTWLLLSRDQSAERECEREGEKPKAGGRALKPSHRLQVLPLCLAYTEAKLLMQMQMRTRASFLFSGEEERERGGGGGGSPNCLSTGSGRIFKNGASSGSRMMNETRPHTDTWAERLGETGFRCNGGEPKGNLQRRQSRFSKRRRASAFRINLRKADILWR